MPAFALTQPVGVGLGWQEPFAGVSPAGGVGFTFVCDGRGIRRLTSLVFTLTTSADVADRVVTVEYQGGDGLSYSVNGNPTAVTASLTQRFAASMQTVQGGTLTTTDLYFPLDPVFLFPGDSLRILVANQSATDALTAIRGVLERYPLDSDLLPTRED